MTTALLAAAAGALISGGGVLLIVAGLVRRDMPEHRGRGSGSERLRRRRPGHPSGPTGRRRTTLAVCSVMAGLSVAALTGWLVAAIVVPAAVLGLPALLRIPKARDVVLLEALDRWVRTLAATLPTGKSVPDAIRLSRRTAPEVLAEPLGRLVIRLNNQWETRDALLRFADDLDSPDADGVIAALVLAAQRGSNGAATTLSALADSLQSILRARRLIETERAKPYIVVRQVTLVSALTLGMALLFGRTFFAPYETPVGQLILSLLLGAYVGSLLLMRRRAAARRRERILVGAHP